MFALLLLSISQTNKSPTTFVPGHVNKRILLLSQTPAPIESELFSFNVMIDFIFTRSAILLLLPESSPSGPPKSFGNSHKVPFIVDPVFKAVNNKSDLSGHGFKSHISLGWLKICRHTIFPDSSTYSMTCISFSSLNAVVPTKNKCLSADSLLYAANVRARYLVLYVDACPLHIFPFCSICTRLSAYVYLLLFLKWLVCF